jgi:hypothetical protein
MLCCKGHLISLIDWQRFEKLINEQLNVLKHHRDQMVDSLVEGLRWQQQRSWGQQQRLEQQRRVEQ